MARLPEPWLRLSFIVDLGDTGCADCSWLKTPTCCFSLPPAHAACRGSYTGSEGGGEEEEGATSDEGDLAELGEMNDEALARHLQQREDRAHYRRLLELAGVGARRLQHPCRALARPGEAVCVWWYRSRGQKETSMRWEQGGDSSLVQHVQQL